jgi:trans-aconitate 2-methyltransferase
MSWNPTQYLKFHGARLRPALDLLQRSVALFPEPMQVKSVLDMGCGPGNITPFLSEAFPSCTIEGLDTSQNMIDRAISFNDKQAHSHRVRFAVQSIEAKARDNNKKYDFVYCNAALHCCPNHEELIPMMLRNLVPDNGGVLAIQMSDTRSQPSHLLMETAALRSGLLGVVGNVRIPRVEQDAAWYYRFLSPIVRDVDMWSTDYIQQLETSYMQEVRSDYHPVLEFTKGTGLLPILEALGGENSERGSKYLKEYNRLLYEAYPTLTVKNHYHSQGKLITLMPFKRFFLLCRT